MAQQISRQDMLSYIESHPKAIVRDIAANFGITTNLASAKLKGYLDGGFVTREVMGTIPSGKEFYGYTAVKQAQGKPRKVRKAIQAKETLETPAPAVAAQPAEDFLNPWVQSLAAALAKQVAAQFSVALHTELQAVMPKLPELPMPTNILDVAPMAPLDVGYTTHQPVEVAPPKERKAKVGIVGLFGNKKQEIEREFSEIYDLEVWYDEGIPRLKSMAISCEIIFVMRYVSHKTTQTLSANGANWRKVSGDFAQLQHDMMDYYFNTTEKA